MADTTSGGATILDRLAIELSLDPRKLQEGLKSVGDQVKGTREENEKHFKSLDTLITSMGRSILGLVATFVSLEAAISAFAATKGISRAGTEFANLGESIGMSVTQLATWENAMTLAGGRAEEVGSAFRFQQAELMKSRLGQGAPAFLGYMQRLGMQDYSSYYDQVKGAFDLDRFNKDLAESMSRANLTAPQRAEYLKQFGFDSPAAQRLFGPDQGRLLEEGRKTSPTEKNAEVFRRLNEEWTKLGQTLTAIRNDLVTNFYEPIKSVLEGITSALQAIHDKGWMAEVNENIRQFKEEGAFKYLLYPHVYDKEGRGHAVPWSEYLRSKAGVTSPAAAAAATSVAPGTQTPEAASPATSNWREWLGLEGSRTWGTWWSGVSGAAAPPAAAAPMPAPAPPPPSSEPLNLSQGTPAAPTMLAPTASAPAAPTTLAPTAPAPPPASFDERFGASFGPRSSLEQLMGLPRVAAATSIETSDRTSTVNNSVSTTIGSMSFHGTGSQTGDVGTAGPGVGIDQDRFRDARYAVNANTALE